MIFELEDCFLFVGKDGHLYRATFDPAWVWVWTVDRVRIEFWEAVYGN